jgi:RHS repeat-associated protein
MTTYTLKNQDFTWKEAHLYGSSRLGLVEVNKLLANASGPVNSPLPPDEVEFYRGKKRYELSNHLGNVLAVVSDKRTLVCISGTQYYEAEIISASDYYPFGMLIQERSYTATARGYRFGFNEKEGDNDVSGSGNQYDYGFRIYNPRLGKFLSVDPLTSSYPWYTPYQFAGNKPIWAIDLDGLEEFYTSDGKLLGKYGENTEIRLVYDDFVEETKTILSATKINEADLKRLTEGSAPGLESKDALALKWGERFNQQSIDDNSEYSSIIFSTRLTGSSKVIFSYTRPDKGEEASTSSEFVSKPNSNLSAFIHSHGGYSEYYENNVFSIAQMKDGMYEPGDITEYVRLGIDGYVSTPNGSLLKYAFWEGGQVVNLNATTIPYDPKDPTSPKPASSVVPPSDDTSTDKTEK